MDTSFSNRSDDELVTLYAEGKDEAFDVLLRRYKDKLYSYIFYAVHQTDVADDVFQETFVKAIVTIRQGGYSCNGKFYAWLTRIAHNLIIDKFRTTQTDNALSFSDITQTLYNSGIVMDDSEEREREAAHGIAQVCQLIDLLPKSQQEVVRMRIYQNLSFKDIAALTGISINTALGRMHYAIINMRKLAGERRISVYSV